MITTTYTCDRCGHSQHDDEQMWKLSVLLKHSRAGYDQDKKEALWCRTCVEQFGLLPIPQKSENKVIEPPPTLEDLIRAIVREEMGQ